MMEEDLTLPHPDYNDPLWQRYQRWFDRLNNTMAPYLVDPEALTHCPAPLRLAWRLAMEQPLTAFEIWKAGRLDGENAGWLGECLQRRRPTSGG